MSRTTIARRSKESRAAAGNPVHIGRAEYRTRWASRSWPTPPTGDRQGAVHAWRNACRSRPVKPASTAQREGCTRWPRSSDRQLPEAAPPDPGRHRQHLQRPKFEDFGAYQFLVLKMLSYDEASAQCRRAGQPRVRGGISRGDLPGGGQGRCLPAGPGRIPQPPQPHRSRAATTWPMP